MECKGRRNISISPFPVPDLIETLWNVKYFSAIGRAISSSDLIETLWNVKAPVAADAPPDVPDLIETLWNVKMYV